MRKHWQFSSLLWCIVNTLVASVHAQIGPSDWNATPFNPPAYPLAVRSPFLNSWAPQGNKPPATNSAWAQLWTNNSTLGWYAAINVDTVSYRLFGDASIANLIAAKQIAAAYTATRTSYLLTAGPMQVNMSFLNPVMPNNLVNQSLSFSYFYISATTTDGEPHSVQLYSDISGEWISGDNTVNITWRTQEVGDVFYIEATPLTPLAFTTINQHAQDASSYYAFRKPEGASLTWQTGQDTRARANFTTNGVVLNFTDPSPRPVDDVDSDFPVFGIAVDLGNITGTSDPVVWAIGLVRDPVVQVIDANGDIKSRSSFFWSAYSTIGDAIVDFLADFPNALSISSLFESKLAEDSRLYGSHLMDLLSLSVPQVLATMDITIALNSDGSWNTSDVTTFMNDMRKVGSAGGVNAVDTIYAAFPALLYLNPALIGYLLKPLLTYQNSAQYTLPYAAQNIGAFYPNATGNNSPHNYGIEETGDMLILALAHSQATGDTGLINEHYDLLQGWANYLVNNSLNPGVQRSEDVDRFTAVNQTNLALKGIIGIGAMAKISYSTGHSTDGDNYQNISASYIQQWQNLTMSSDKSHLRMAFGQDQTSGLVYNMYADKLLKLDLVPSEIYEVQSSFCANQAADAQNEFGLPLDNSEPDLSRSDWMMYSAAMTGASIRDFLISQVWQYASSSQGNSPFSVVYNPTTGQARDGANSAAQGAMFALLALNSSDTPASVGGGGIGGDENKKRVNTGAVAGGMIGGLLAVGILIFLAFFLRRRRHKARTVGSPRRGFGLTDESESASPLGSVISPPRATLRTSRKHSVNTGHARTASFGVNGSTTPTPSMTVVSVVPMTKERYPQIPYGSSSGVNIMNELRRITAIAPEHLSTGRDVNTSEAENLEGGATGDGTTREAIHLTDVVRSRGYEELSSEMIRLQVRREMEQILLRGENAGSLRQLVSDDEAPPSYAPHIS